MWENCSHIEGTICDIYKQRKELWFWACEEFGCFGAWALVTEWLKNSWADFSWAESHWVRQESTFMIYLIFI